MGLERFAQRADGRADGIDLGYEPLKLAFGLGYLAFGLGHQGVFVAEEVVQPALFGDGLVVPALERGVLALYALHYGGDFGYSLVYEFLFGGQRAHAFLYVGKVFKGVHYLFAVLARHVFVLGYTFGKAAYLLAEGGARLVEIVEAGGVLARVVLGALYLLIYLADALGGIRHLLLRLLELGLYGVGLLLEHLALARSFGNSHRVADALVVESL